MQIVGKACGILAFINQATEVGRLCSNIINHFVRTWFRVLGAGLTTKPQEGRVCTGEGAEEIHRDIARDGAFQL